MPISKSEKETQEIAATIADQIKDGGVIICLYGELGSGKTSFTKGLASALGIDPFSVKSPTYTYVREYKLDGHSLYHVDLYRLDGPDELIGQAIQEMAENHRNIIVIEWADKIDFKLPDNKKEIHFEYVNETSRKITMS